MIGLMLTSEQLKQLTGYKVRSLQTEWLKENGVPFRADAAGRLIVLASHVERWVAGDQLRPSTAPLLDLVR